MIDDQQEPRVVSGQLLCLGYRQGQPGIVERFWVDLDGGAVIARYELSANAFGLLAVLVTGPHPDVVVLSRKSVSGPYEAVGSFSEQDAANVVEKLRGQR